MFGLTGSRFAPWAALALTLFIWAGYLVTTRAVMTGPMGPIDLGILRAVPAALIVLPLTFKRGLWPGGANWTDIAIMALLGGVAFTTFLPLGLRYAPVADSGILTPSMLPVFVAVLSILFLKAKFKAQQWLGFILIVVGAIAVGGGSILAQTVEGAWRGHLFFLSAAICWAAFTVRFRVSGLSAMDGVILLLTWTSIAFLVALPFVGSNLLSLSTPMLLLQIAMGVAAGLLANITFLASIRALGHEIPAAGAALVPVLAALGGWIFLGEPIGVMKTIGIFIVCCGVVLASGLLSRRESL